MTGRLRARVEVVMPCAPEDATMFHPGLGGDTRVSDHLRVTLDRSEVTGPMYLPPGKRHLVASGTLDLTLAVLCDDQPATAFAALQHAHRIVADELHGLDQADRVAIEAGAA